MQRGLSILSGISQAASKLTVAIFCAGIVDFLNKFHILCTVRLDPRAVKIGDKRPKDGSIQFLAELFINKRVILRLSKVPAILPAR